MQPKVKFDFVCIFYANGVDQKVSIRGINHNLPEDRTVMTLFGERTRLDDYIRNYYVAKINSFDNLIHESAKLYIADSYPVKPDSYYSSTNYVVEIDLTSTAREVYQKFHSRFPGSAKPIVILKLYYVTRQV